MLIVSGGDLVGKSTFVRHAYERLDELGFRHMPHHLTKPPASFDYYKGYLELVSPHTVWDRFALDCLPYRNLDEHPCTMTPMKWSLVEAACKRAGGFQVVMYAGDDDTIRKRFKANRPGETHMYPLEHALRVNDEFRRMRSHSTYTMRGLHYRVAIDAVIDTDMDPVDPVIDLYIEHFRKWTSLQ